MNTTAIVIEILIGGLQTTIWLALIILSIFGYGWIQLNTVEKLLGLTIFIITISYTFGVLFDRLWDFLLQKPDEVIRNRYFSKSELYSMRVRIFSKSEPMAKFLDYIRSRMRIARASFCNFCLITATSLLFILTQLNHFDALLNLKLLLFTSTCGMLLALLAFYAWKKITNTYYKQMLTIYKGLFEETETISKS